MEEKRTRQKAVRFTDKLIQNLPIPTDRKGYLRANATVRGMSVRVTQAGGKTFCFRHGSGPRIVIGPWPTWNVAKAEAHVRVLIGKIAAGENPIAEYRVRRGRKRAILHDEVLTFEAAVSAYVQRNPNRASGERLKRIPQLLSRVYASFYRKPFDEVSPEEVLNCLSALKAPALAHQACATARTVCRWTAKKYKVVDPFATLDDDDLPPEPPAREVYLRGDQILKVRKGILSLYPVDRDLFDFLLHTLVRRQEAAGALWSEFDAPHFTTWTVAKERMKGGRKARTHDVPLTRQTAAIVRRRWEQRQSGSDLVFTRTGRKYNNFGHARRKLREILRGEDLPKFVLHDFRRTGINWLMEAGEDEDMCDRLLAHEPQGQIQKRYNPYKFRKEKLELLTKWSDFLDPDGKAPSGLTVVEAPALEGEVEAELPSASPELLKPTGTEGPLPAIVLAPEPQAFDLRYALFLSSVFRSKGVVNGAYRAWQAPESEYLGKFLDGVPDREMRAGCALAAIWDEALTFALIFVSVVKDNTVIEAEKELGRQRDKYLKLEEGYRQDAKQTPTLGVDYLLSQAKVAADMAALYQRRIDALPRPAHPLVIRHRRGDASALAEGIQKALFAFVLPRIFRHPNHFEALVTEIANAVSSGTTSRYKLRKDRWRA
jgi:integrase